MSANYLLNRDGRYYFRVRVPPDLRGWFGGRGEIKKSLRTIQYAIGKGCARILLYRTEKLFTLIRSAMLTDDQIRGLVARYLGQILGDTEEGRAEGFGLPKTSEEHADSLDALELLLVGYKEALALGRYADIEPVAKGILGGAGIEIDKDSPEYAKLCREVLKGVIEATAVDIERMKGNYTNEYDRRTSYLHTSPPSQESPTSGTGKEEIPLSTAMNEYVREHSAGGNWTPKTKAESEGIYALFVGIVGDRDIRTLTRKELTDFRDALTRFPSNVKKKKRYRGKSIAEILQMEVSDPFSVSSVNKHLIRVGAFLKWAVDRRYIETNYADGLTIAKRNTKESEEREAYSKEDIERLIASPLYTGNEAKSRPERYWIPLIGLFSGMRQNEICQLHLEDIREEEDILCFDINGEGDRRLKNASSKRLIPVHPVLLGLGFKTYVDGLRAEGKTRLWENLKRKRDGYAQDFGKWYGRFNRKNITDNPKRVFHSFRHTLADNLKQKKVEGVVIAEILGHSHGSITLSRYGKGYSPTVLLEALNQLDYGIPVESLQRWS